jgi:hypothetical protein
MIWPNPKLVKYIVDTYRIPVILQVNKVAMDRCHSDPGLVSDMLLHMYGTGVSGVLFDKSMGKGEGMDAKFLRRFVEYFSINRPDLHVAVAGGLGPVSLNLVEPLIHSYPVLSFDAQGQLRDSGDSKEPIDWIRADNYVKKAVELTR